MSVHAFFGVWLGGPESSMDWKFYGEPNPDCEYCGGNGKDGGTSETSPCECVVESFRENRHFYMPESLRERYKSMNWLIRCYQAGDYGFEFYARYRGCYKNVEASESLSVPEVTDQDIADLNAIFELIGKEPKKPEFQVVWDWED